MISILDRYLLRSLAFNYFVALAVMISLYVVLDMFVNMDEFTEHGYPVATVLANIVSYYAPNVCLYFSQLSGVITLVACMAALARARKFNELTAILASGVSLYRVAAPVVAFGLTTTVLLVIDTEWVIPSVAHLLARDRDDVDGKRAYEVLFLRDRNDSLLSAGQFHPLTRDLRRLLVLTRDESGSVARTLEADRATWHHPPGLPEQGRWKLERGRLTTRAAAETAGLGPQTTESTTLVEWYDSDLSPLAIQLRQTEGWVRYLSLRQLDRLLKSGSPDRWEILQTKHARIAAPLVSMVLLLLGLPFFLDRAPASVLSDAGGCTLACGLCYVATFVAQSIRPESQSALPAWIPIFIFATVAMVLIDRIRT
ncbi:MAG: LptF/LptG family permease [Planctomycetes bacterium]|nr:LptF/LptG family permease [Planctomycetota bacterium]